MLELHYYLNFSHQSRILYISSTGGTFHMLVNGNLPFFRLIFESISDLWVLVLASSGFLGLGAILSAPRIYGYTFAKKTFSPKIVSPALFMLGVFFQ